MYLTGVMAKRSHPHVSHPRLCHKTSRVFTSAPIGTQEDYRCEHQVAHVAHLWVLSQVGYDGTSGLLPGVIPL